MFIGAISDTHDHVPHIKQAVDIFRKRDVDLVVHAGDYCSPFTISHFEGLPFEGIFGNNDGDYFLLMQKFDAIDATIHGDFFEFNADSRMLAVYHGTDQPITDALINCGKYDVVISGHTHEPMNKKTNNTLALNPGTAHGFDEKATIALLNTDNLQTEFVELD
ncbi:MAG TPA: metallophosphoesterase [Balneolaceae bacterium]|nr:metallophosphoesterase [Balneolaceae bacterium]